MILLTALVVLGILGAASPATHLPCVTGFSFRFTIPITRRGFRGIIPTASHALRIFSGVKASLRAGIRILLDGRLEERKKRKKRIRESKYER